MKSVELMGGRRILYPYLGVEATLQQVLQRPNRKMVWRMVSYSKEDSYCDVYDGKVWQDFMNYNGSPFLSEPNNLALMLNMDFFQPYVHYTSSSRENGVPGWSVLFFTLQLPYFDAPRMLIVDPMHNLFLGSAKCMMQSIWIERKILTDQHFKVIQQRVDRILVPSGIGRILLKIQSGFSVLDIVLFNHGSIRCTECGWFGVLVPFCSRMAAIVSPY